MLSFETILMFIAEVIIESALDYIKTVDIYFKKSSYLYSNRSMGNTPFAMVLKILDEKLRSS